MVRVSDPPDAQLHVSTDAATATTPLLPPWLRAPPLPRRSEASVGMACSATLMRLVCSPFARSLTTTTTTSHTHRRAGDDDRGLNARRMRGSLPRGMAKSRPPNPIHGRSAAPASILSPISPPHPTPLHTPEGRITLPHPRPPCGPRPFSRPRPFRGTPAAHFYTLLRPPALSPPCCTQRQWCARDIIIIIIIIIITPRLDAACSRPALCGVLTRNTASCLT